MPKFKIYYERNLPHIQPPGATLFLTYRLVNSIPSEMLQMVRAEAQRISEALASEPDNQETAEKVYREHIRLFGKWDAILDEAGTGPQWLSSTHVAQEVCDSLHFLNKRSIDLDTYCIMSNHVHVVFRPLFDNDTGSYYSISSIMKSHKGFTARKCNDILGRKGQFWQHESFDHFVRDQAELERIRRYVIMNPVKAGLVGEFDQWSWTYCKYL